MRSPRRGTRWFAWCLAGLLVCGVLLPEAGAAQESQRPLARSLEATTGPAGMVLLIQGTGFGDALTGRGVRVGERQAAVRTWTDTEIEIELPPDLSDGDYPIRVESAGGVSSALSFRVENAVYLGGTIWQNTASIEVVTASGQPVRNAEVAVNGTMLAFRDGLYQATLGEQSPGSQVTLSVRVGAVAVRGTGVLPGAAQIRLPHTEQQLQSDLPFQVSWVPPAVQPTERVRIYGGVDDPELLAEVDTAARVAEVTVRGASGGGWLGVESFRALELEGSFAGNDKVMVAAIAWVNPVWTHPPQITRVDPALVAPGETLTLDGRGFGAVGAVYIAGIRAEVQSWQDRRVTVMVPAGVMPGRQFAVILSGGRWSAPAPVDVPVVEIPEWYRLEAAAQGIIPVWPRIESLETSVGPTGMSVRVRGANFGRRTPDSTIRLGEWYQNITSWTDREIQFTVREDMPPGDFVLWLAQGPKVANRVPFTVTNVVMISGRVTRHFGPGEPGGEAALRLATASDVFIRNARITLGGDSLSPRTARQAYELSGVHWDESETVALEVMLGHQRVIVSAPWWTPARVLQPVAGRELVLGQPVQVEWLPAQGQARTVHVWAIYPRGRIEALPGPGARSAVLDFAPAPAAAQAGTGEIVVEEVTSVTLGVGLLQGTVELVQQTRLPVEWVLPPASE